jgi:hypothetical protein
MEVLRGELTVHRNTTVVAVPVPLFLIFIYLSHGRKTNTVIPSYQDFEAPEILLRPITRGPETCASMKKWRPQIESIHEGGF